MFILNPFGILIYRVRYLDNDIFTDVRSQNVYPSRRGLRKLPKSIGNE